jgi:hypothetical protein
VPGSPWFIDAADRGTWVEYKFQNVYGTAPGSKDGIARAWKNGVLFMDITDHDSYNPDATNKGYTAGYLMGAVNGGFVVPTTMYIDNFTLSTVDPDYL